MNFKQYLSESAKTYKFRIKTVAEFDKDSHAMLKSYLSKFNLIEILPSKKTILQKNPLDFGPEIQNQEVLIIDIIMGLPVSPFILEKELTTLMRLPQGYLLVRGEHDALETQISAMEQEADIARQADKKSLGASTLLGVESEYPEADQTADGSNYYGNEYNGRFLKYLKAESEERKEKARVEAPAPLFSWLEYDKLTQTPDDDQEFNKHLEKFGIVTKPDPEALKPGRFGEFTGSDKVVKKDFVNKNGDHKTLKGKTNPIGGKK